MDLDCRYRLGCPGDRLGGTRFRRSAFGFDQQMTHGRDLTINKNVLMEPSISADLTGSGKNAGDLTKGLLNDIGW